MTDALLSRWIRHGYPPALASRLFEAYQAPPRVYHTLEHLQHAFSLLDSDPRAVQARHRLTDPEQRALELAIWYHDCVYDPRRHDNEVESANRFLEDALLLRIAPAVREHVVELILASRDHQPPPADGLAALFCDVDLAILGDTPERYNAYRNGIRCEYGHLPNNAYAIGRRGVLDGLLARPRLYSVLLDREAPARANLLAERERLRERPC